MITSSYPSLKYGVTLAILVAGSPSGVEEISRQHAGLFTLLGLVVTAIGVLVAVAGLWQRNRKTTTGSHGDPLRRRVRELLLDYVEQRASANDGLRQAIRIDLKLTHTPAAVPVELRVIENGGPQHTERSTEDTVAQVFKRTGGRLLILGDPGTGKTNLLYELARHLVVAARHDVDQSIPIVLNLARWTLGERSRTIQEWIKDELHKLYGLTVRDAETLIAADDIIPLLDGLDEVDEGRRARCVEAINEYQDTRSLGRFAICCRWQEYTQLTNAERSDSRTLPIKARWALRIERMTQADVDRAVSDVGLERVRQILDSDPELRAFVDTPLWLHVLFLGALSEPFSSDSPTPRDRLYDNYVAHVLTRRPAAAGRARTSDQKLLRQLGWLARQMRVRYQTQFVLEDLAFSWVFRVPTESASRAQRAGTRGNGRVRLHQRLMFGAAMGLLGWLAAGWILGALLAVLAAVRIEGRIDAAERLHFDWRSAVSRWPLSLAYGGLFALAFALLHGLLAGAVLWVFAALFEMFQGGFQPLSGDGALAPNHSTMRSLRYALRVASAGCAVALAAVAAARWMAVTHVIGALAEGAITEGARWVAVAALILGGEKGGWFALRHYAVRIALWWRGDVSPNYVAFLNESVERLFLNRRGGAYEFIHPTFRDFMAAHYGGDYGDISRPKQKKKAAKHRHHQLSANIIVARLTASAQAILGASS